MQKRSVIHTRSTQHSTQTYLDTVAAKRTISGDLFLGNSSEASTVVNESVCKLSSKCLSLDESIANQNSTWKCNLFLEQNNVCDSNVNTFEHASDFHSGNYNGKNQMQQKDNGEFVFDSMLLTESLFGGTGSSTDESEGNDDDCMENKEKDTHNECDNRDCDNRACTFLLWNVNGIMTKVFDPDFVSFVNKFDVVCFVETFIEFFSLEMFNDFRVFVSPSVKMTHAGRPSGGVMCLIKKVFMPFVKKIDVNTANLLLFSIDKAAFGTLKDILLICTYVPPEGSNFYSFIGEEKNGISILESNLLDYVANIGDYYIILNGDLNSRTSNISQKICLEKDDFSSCCKSGPITKGRKSNDSVINTFGKTLLNFCTAFNLCILNGVCNGDLDGRYTYISESGCSVIDYFVVSSELYALLYDNIFLEVINRIESCHMPVCFTINHQHLNEINVKEEETNIYVEKMIWEDSNVNLFNDALNSDAIKSKFQQAHSLIQDNVNEALATFNDVLREIGSCMSRRVCVNGKKKKECWFDYECVVARRKVRQLLRAFFRTRCVLSKQSYCAARREYKNLLVKKKRHFNNEKINMLLESVNDNQLFWKNIKNTIPKKNSVSNNIPVELWFSHFKTLLEGEEDVFLNEEINDHLIENEENDFDVPISEEEVLLAIRKLKCKKAAGPDGIIAEVLKNASRIIVPFFVTFLNKLFDNGSFPEAWSESIILPIFKKGDTNNPSNYRGISLCNISSKIYSFIINRRLQMWVDENNLTGEYQAGFKKNYSTIDHIFTLMACVQKQFSNNKKLYVAFIDISKCFDSINRHLLWPILMKNGINGKLLRCLQSMYKCVRARVRCKGNSLSQIINCFSGLKQGEITSPLLSSLFMNEITLEVIRNGKHGVNFINDNLELFILLLADDIVLLSESIVGLQSQLNSLQRAANALSLKVNTEKSNIVVFRKGGYLGKRERWFYDGNILPVVNMYTYLGICFSTKLVFSTACANLASKAKRACLCIFQKLKLYENNSFPVFCKFFDFKIKPIMLYGSEIWGLDGAAQNCEKTHLFGLKKFLNVNMRTPNDMIYSELHRYPITIDSAVSCIRYWLRVLCMDVNRLPWKSYVMLKVLDERGKKNWATNVRMCLYMNGFGYAWENQGVGNVHLFMRLFKTRLIDTQWQSCFEHIGSSDRFNVYDTFFSRSSLPVYLSLNINRQLKFIMSKFRFGVSEIKTHAYRYKSFLQYDKLCPVCHKCEEDEMHFILCCPFYYSLREMYIPKKFFLYPNMFRLSLLMSSQNREIITNLCTYLYKAFNKRTHAITND